MRTKTLAIVLAFLAILPPGCITSDGEVVSRSAQDRPAWADGTLPEEPSKSVLSLYKKGDIFRLELGIRQAQALALADSKNLMLHRLRQELKTRAQELLGTTEAAAVAAPLDNAVASFGANFEAPDASPYRVYHEEIRKNSESGTQITYDVYVLVALPRSVFEQALLAIAKTLAAASDARLKKLGNEIDHSLVGDANSND